MSAQNHVPCLGCQKGSLLAVYEPYPVRISELQTVMSDPARFMKCDSCGDVIMHGDETKRADLSAGKNLLNQVIQQEQTLNGQAVSFLRALVSITAKELSLRLDATTVSQWEGRNTVLPQPTAFAVSVFFLRGMTKDRHEFLKVIEDLILKAFSKVE
jgi:DNA-binding transcriptional regulator YiaG